MPGLSLQTGRGGRDRTADLLVAGAKSEPSPRAGLSFCPSTLPHLPKAHRAMR